MSKNGFCQHFKLFTALTFNANLAGIITAIRSGHHTTNGFKNLVLLRHAKRVCCLNYIHSIHLILTPADIPCSYTYYALFNSLRVVPFDELIPLAFS